MKVVTRSLSQKRDHSGADWKKLRRKRASYCWRSKKSSSQRCRCWRKLENLRANHCQAPITGRVEESIDLWLHDAERLQELVSTERETKPPNMRLTGEKIDMSKSMFLSLKNNQATSSKENCLEQARFVSNLNRGFGRPVWRCSGHMEQSGSPKWGVDSPTGQSRIQSWSLMDKLNKLMLALTDEFKMSFGRGTNQANELENLN